MCSISVTRQNNDTSKIALRGPDYHGRLEMNGFIFQHFLLAINGFGKQPIVDGDVVLVWNGELYMDFEECDSELIIPLYRKYGKDFVRHISGEWAIALYDFEKNVVIHATDLFGTKPLWVKGNECASYYSALPGSTKVPANTMIVNGVQEKIHEFDFNQYKKTYKDWISAFENAVNKRITEHSFIGLSSGYDSGGISLALKRLQKPCKRYSIIGLEDPTVIKERGGEIIPMDDAEVDYLKKNVEPYEYKYLHNGQEVKKWLHSDDAIYGLGKICRKAREDGCRVYLSGQGADEILCDYEKFPSQSYIKGDWSKATKPWPNFYGGQMENYLMKEEMIAGAYGLEARYPYLDKEVVQEFLWLHPDYKKEYKAPLAEYLRRNNYPTAWGTKIGFNP